MYEPCNKNNDLGEKCSLLPPQFWIHVLFCLHKFKLSRKKCFCISRAPCQKLMPEMMEVENGSGAVSKILI